MSPRILLLLLRFRIQFVQFDGFDDDDDDVSPVVVSVHDRWNHEENRPNTFVEDAMKHGSSGGGGNSQSYASEPEKEVEVEERQDDPDPPSDTNSDD